MAASVSCFQDYHAAKKDISQSSDYRKVQNSLHHPEDVWAEYLSICSKVQHKTRITGLFSALVRDANVVGVERIFSTLGATVKTHKDQGEQVLRPLHKSVSTPFLPGMKFLCSYLSEFLKTLPHILRNSQQAKEEILDLVLLGSDKFVKVDIKDFFMSGSHPSLTDA